MPDVALISQSTFEDFEDSGVVARDSDSPLRDTADLDQELEAAISESKRARGALVDLTSASQQRPNFRTLSTSSSSDEEVDRHGEKRALSKRKVRRRRKRTDSCSTEEEENANTNDHVITSPKAKSALRVPDAVGNVKRQKSSKKSTALAPLTDTKGQLDSSKKESKSESKSIKLKENRKIPSIKRDTKKEELPKKYSPNQATARELSENAPTSLKPKTNPDMPAKPSRSPARRKKTTNKSAKKRSSDKSSPAAKTESGISRRRTPPGPDGLMDLEALIAAQDSKSSKVSHKDIQGFLHRSRMHLKVEDVRRHMDIAKAIGTMDTKKLKAKARNVRLASLDEEESAQSSQVEDAPLSASKSGSARRNRSVSPRRNLTRLSKLGAPSGSTPNLPGDQARHLGSNGGPPSLKTSRHLEPTPKIGKSGKGTSNARAQEKADALKRLELIKAARKAKKDKDPTAGEQSQEETRKLESYTMKKMQLPIVIENKKRNKKADKVYADADVDFYKDFKMIFVNLPMPNDDLPREYSEIGTWFSCHYNRTLK